MPAVIQSCIGAQYGRLGIVCEQQNLSNLAFTILIIYVAIIDYSNRQLPAYLKKNLSLNMVSESRNLFHFGQDDYVVGQIQRSFRKIADHQIDRTVNL